jgi:integrase
MARDGFPWYRKGKRCWYVWYGGRQVRLHEDKAEALRLWHRLEAGCGEEPGRPGGARNGPTVAEAVDAYLAEAGGRLKPSTMRTKRKVLGRLKAQLGAEPAGELTAAAVLAWLDGQRWGRSTRWLAGLVVKTALRELAPQLAELSLPGPRSRGAEALVNPADHEALLAAAPPAYRDALLTLWATGCRPGELCRLEARHLDTASSSFVLHEHKTDETGKPRVILLPPATLTLCRELAARHPAGPLFRNCRGEPLTPDRLRGWVFEARRRLRLGRLTPYGYRHTFATDALAGGVPDAQVAGLLGHANTTMLHRHYSHLTARARALREALGRVR